MTWPFHVVDVFAESPYTGNQLAVIVGADGLADETLQMIATETNCSPLVYLFCSETRHHENDLCARFFFEAHGVREDPATGNGAAFLGAYLLEHGFFPGSELSLRIEQGYEVRRPSLVLLRARMIGRTREVSVGGLVIPTVRGELL